jgi:hypothetical protein
VSPLSAFVDFYEIQYGDIAIEGDLDAIVFNAVAAAITKWWTTVCLPDTPG